MFQICEKQKYLNKANQCKAWPYYKILHFKHYIVITKTYKTVPASIFPDYIKPTKALVILISRFGCSKRQVRK